MAIRMALLTTERIFWHCRAKNRPMGADSADFVTKICWFLWHVSIIPLANCWRRFRALLAQDSAPPSRERLLLCSTARAATAGALPSLRSRHVSASDAGQGGTQVATKQSARAQPGCVPSALPGARASEADSGTVAPCQTRTR